MTRATLRPMPPVAPVIQAVISIGNRRLASEDPVSNYHRILTAHERLLDPLSRYDADSVIEVLAEQFSITQAQFRLAESSEPDEA